MELHTTPHTGCQHSGLFDFDSAPEAEATTGATATATQTVDLDRELRSTTATPTAAPPAFIAGAGLASDASSTSFLRYLGEHGPATVSAWRVERPPRRPRERSQTRPGVHLTRSTGGALGLDAPAGADVSGQAGGGNHDPRGHRPGSHGRRQPDNGLQL